MAAMPVHQPLRPFGWCERIWTRGGRFNRGGFASLRRPAALVERSAPSPSSSSRRRAEGERDAADGQMRLTASSGIVGALGSQMTYPSLGVPSPWGGRHPGSRKSTLQRV